MNVSTQLELVAQKLDAARVERRAVGQFDPPFDLDLAYAAQAELIKLRLGRGERLMGLKMGFTSRAKMVQMGVNDLIWGRITDAMMVEDGGTVAVSDYLHPRAEPEIAFLLSKPLKGRVTPLEALDAVAGIAPAIEIIDSRYENFRFTHAEVVADNCSGAGFVVGPWSSPEISTANLGMVMSVNGKPKHFASSASLMGHPLRSLVAAARLVEQYGALGGELEAGSVVLAGAGTPAVPIVPGQYVSVEVEQLGECGFLAVEA